MIAGGIGLGSTCIPVFSLATRDLQPHLAGAASGVINTIQELGSVIASAVIGTVLQNAWPTTSTCRRGCRSKSRAACST